MYETLIKTNKDKREKRFKQKKEHKPRVYKRESK